MLSGCVGDVLGMFSGCVGDAFWMFSGCFGHVFPQARVFRSMVILGLAGFRFLSFWTDLGRAGFHILTCQVGPIRSGFGKQIRKNTDRPELMYAFVRVGSGWPFSVFV